MERAFISGDYEHLIFDGMSCLPTEHDDLPSVQALNITPEIVRASVDCSRANRQNLTLKLEDRWAIGNAGMRHRHSPHRGGRVVHNDWRDLPSRWERRR